MEFLTQILTYLYPILTVLIQVGICVAIVGLVGYILKILKSKGIDLINSDLVDVEGIVTKVVRYLNQTIVDKMKEASEDGKLTDEQINEIQNKALDLIYKLLDSSTMDSLISKYGENYTEYIKILIENSVVDAKNDDLKIIEASAIPLSEISVTSDLVSDNDNNGSYTATRTATATNGTLLGMNSTAWTWLILGIATIAIVALVWYYGKQYDNNKTRIDDGE